MNITKRELNDMLVIFRTESYSYYHSSKLGHVRIYYIYRLESGIMNQILLFYDGPKYGQITCAWDNSQYKTIPLNNEEDTNTFFQRLNKEYNKKQMICGWRDSM